MTLIQVAASVLSELMAHALSQPLVIGLASLAAAVVVGTVPRAWGFLVLWLGTIGAVLLAVREYQSSGDPNLLLLILIGGICLSGFVGWLIYPAGLMGTVAFFAAGWYLILSAFLGPSAGQSLAWDLVWAALVVACTYAVHRATRMIMARRAIVQDDPEQGGPEPATEQA